MGFVLLTCDRLAYHSQWNKDHAQAHYGKRRAKKNRFSSTYWSEIINLWWVNIHAFCIAYLYYFEDLFTGPAMKSYHVHYQNPRKFIVVYLKYIRDWRQYVIKITVANSWLYKRFFQCLLCQTHGAISTSWIHKVKEIKIWEITSISKLSLNYLNCLCILKPCPFHQFPK